jgi:hypothetical protein
MDQVELNLSKVPTMYHIIDPERALHIINRAAAPNNVYYIIQGNSTERETVRKPYGMCSGGKVIPIQHKKYE